MNKAMLIGRLTRDPELRKTNNGTSYCGFTIAVGRQYKNQATGEYESDFINCVAWRQAAEYMCNHLSKGTMIGVTGEINTRNYEDKDGKKVYVTEIKVDSVERLSVQPKAEDAQPAQKPTMEEATKNLLDLNTGPAIDISSDDLPF